MRHTWPGNIRELRNVVERGLVLGRGSVIGPEHLPLEPANLVPDVPRVGSRTAPTWVPPDLPPVKVEESRSLKDHVNALERERIIQALEQCAGNQTKAAKLLGISRRTLLTRLDEWGLPRPRK
jgi:DNA-binding NtrC family response regulator